MKRPRNTPKAKRNARRFDRVTDEAGRKVRKRHAIERIERVEFDETVRDALLNGEWTEDGE